MIFPLKLVIEFPSGASILLPSSSVWHGNTPVQPGETRTSFSQYCAGGLLRWPEYGFRTMNTCKIEDLELWEKMDGLADDRWIEAVARFSKVEEIHRDRIAVFEL